MTTGSLLTISFVLLLTFIANHCSPLPDFENSFNDPGFHGRDTVYDTHEIDARKPVRKNGDIAAGIGSLLLKNLRFRDVYYPQESAARSDIQSTVSLNDDLRMINALHNLPEYRQYVENDSEHHSPSTIHYEYPLFAFNPFIGIKCDW